ncbi:MAG: LacI family DNA-binding transcriptional regulator [Verrucomicrobia bacterium]|nr:LacI family DNA-binding transcriptional regulator [Verrucomicrobiota bacterium]
MKPGKESPLVKTPLLEQPSLPERVADVLREEIHKQHRPGERLPTIRELAGRFDVSINTVHHALAVLRREGSVEAWVGSGTYVADRIGCQHVALWLRTDPLYPHPAFASRIANRLHSFLVQQGLEAKIYSICGASDEGEPQGDAAYAEFLKDLSLHRINAFGIIQGTVDSETTKRIARGQAPVVWGQLGTVRSRFAVGNDPAETVREGTRYLLERGCRKIAWLSWSDPRWGDKKSGPCYMAFHAALSLRGVKLRDEWIRGDLHPTLAGAGYEEFREIWTSCKEKPDGLLVTDDILFQDVVTAILELRIAVPDRLKVVATANKGMVTCPFFSAARMEFDPDEQAGAMGNMLAKLARKETVAPRQIKIPFRWVEKTTVVREFSNAECRMKDRDQKSVTSNQ